MIRAAVAGGLIVLFACAVWAKDAQIGATSMTLPAPSNFCEMQESNAADARMLTVVQGMIAGKNQLLAMSADCNQLKDWRTGKRKLLDDFAQYQTLISMMNTELPIPPEQAVKEICASLRAEGEKMLSGMMPDIKARAQELMKNVKVNEMRFAGVLAEEPLACYAGLLQKFRTEVGTDKTQVGVFVTTILKGKVVYYYLFTPYVNEDTIVNLLAKHKANYAKLVAANR
jgi:hypothetical protein